MNSKLIVDGRVVRGHQVASGLGGSPYPSGTIEMQRPHFLARGLDLSPYHSATLNVSIAPHSFTMVKPRYTFRDVCWTELIPPEDFSFSPCELHFADSRYSGLVYYPHPETKPMHFQSPMILEILVPIVDGIGYGDEVTLELDSAEIIIDQPEPAD